MDVTMRGWAEIPLNSLKPMQVLKLKKRLTIQPRQTYGDTPKPPLEMFREDLAGGVLHVPRAFAVHTAKRENNWIDRTSSGFPIHLDTTWKAIGPWKEQEVAVRRMVAALEKPPWGAILQGGCGFGKTATGLEVARRLGGTTLVLVHKEFLLKQWVDRIKGCEEKRVTWNGVELVRPAVKGFWPEAEVGIVRGNKCEFEGKDIVIAMVQSLASTQEYPRELYRWARTLITDEVHRIGAATWAPLMPRFAAKYRIGLSATLRRKDGADNVFWWQIGETAFKARSKQMPFKVKRIATGWSCESGVPDATALSMMCKTDWRTRDIIDELRLAVDAGRKILVMSERLNLLESIKLGIEKQRPDCRTGVYTGAWFESSSIEDRKKKTSARKKRKVTDTEKWYAECCDVIFATKQTVEEGLDIWDLDTLFLVTPLHDCEQAVGRIRRWAPKPELGKHEPLVVDFIDDVGFAISKARGRMRFYKESGLFQEE